MTHHAMNTPVESACNPLLRGWRLASRQFVRVASAVAIGAATLAPATVHAQLTSGCPAHVYLGNDPSNTEAPDWTEDAQGLANDGAHWFITQKTDLFKYDKNWQAVDNAVDIGELASVGLPSQLSALGINHFGDPDYYGGYVFVPFEGGDALKAVIASYRASDLQLVDWVDVTENQPKAGWIAFNSIDQALYTSDDHLVAGTPLLQYALDLSKLENGVQGDFLSAPSPVQVLDFDGSAVAGKFEYMQGGVFTPWGDLYLSVGKSGDSPSSTRGGLHLLRRTGDGQAFQLIESSANSSVPAGTAEFAYEYQPGSSDTGEEPEGIDWWNQDNDPDARYAGQLHAILLDNDLFEDDQIWLKHYAVDYFCMLDQDSDGDGISDGDEGYVYNTDPLVPDADQDGVDDPADNCRDVAERRSGGPRWRWLGRRV